MFKMFRSISVIFAVIGGISWSAITFSGVLTNQSSDPRISQYPAVEAVMLEYLRSFNAKDVERWSKTMLFPHIRIASGGIILYPTASDLESKIDLHQFAKDNNWSRSEWKTLDVIQASPDKVHVKVEFTRFDKTGEPYVSYNSLYVLQREKNGDWGIRARSSFAP